MKKIPSSILAIFCFSMLWGQEQSKQIKTFCDKTLSSITYSMNHPLHSWTGESKDIISIIVTDETKSVISKVAVSTRISTFDSQNANRDSHMIEVTEGIKFPTVNFTSNSIKQDGNKLTVTGILTFHGISQPITFIADKAIINNKLVITGSFNLTLTQFKIEPPSLMGVATDDAIVILFKAVY